MPAPDQRTDRFRYEGFVINPGEGSVTLTYATADRTFTETYGFDPTGDWDNPAVEAAVRILFLVAGVSYYKTTAAPVIDLGATPTTPAEKTFLTTFYREGLGEFAYRNHLDLTHLTVLGPEAVPAPVVANAPMTGRPLVPFGGGIDSIVTVHGLSQSGADLTLCVVHPPGERFAAIEDAAAVTGLPVTHITRQIDEQVRHSAELGFLNGHVPITAVITAAVMVAAVLGGHDAVVLSNEWSASAPTLIHDGHPVNHQWSKSLDFETAFDAVVTSALGSDISVFSYLRNRSELWVARQFADLTEFHHIFRSCNRAFHQDRSDRLALWCGVCDKCCFINLILAPYMEASDLRAVFAGHEPLDNPELEGRFRTLLGLDPNAKPFECVGDVGECRAALVLASARADRTQTPLLQSLTQSLTAQRNQSDVETLLAPMGPHFIPERYAPADLLV
ncbi:MAG TPA: hypothetical protein VHV57_07110 [Acidimicrobiales bacterium]|jgi:hypothetical protein|nr:hypothetical protein [Acidimicrobiales bacterium]